MKLNESQAIDLFNKGQYGVLEKSLALENWGLAQKLTQWLMEPVGLQVGQEKSEGLAWYKEHCLKKIMPLDQNVVSEALKYILPHVSEHQRKSKMMPLLIDLMEQGDGKVVDPWIKKWIKEAPSMSACSGLLKGIKLRVKKRMLGTLDMGSEVFSDFMVKCQIQTWKNEKSMSEEQCLTLLWGAYTSNQKIINDALKKMGPMEGWAALIVGYCVKANIWGRETFLFNQYKKLPAINLKECMRVAIVCEHHQALDWLVSMGVGVFENSNLFFIHTERLNARAVGKWDEKSFAQKIIEYLAKEKRLMEWLQALPSMEQINRESGVRVSEKDLCDWIKGLFLRLDAKNLMTDVFSLKQVEVNEWVKKGFLAYQKIKREEQVLLKLSGAQKGTEEGNVESKTQKNRGSMSL